MAGRASSASFNAKTLPNGDNGYFRQAGQQIGVTATNDFIFGDLHVALRKQLYDGMVGSKIADAMALSTLPEAPPVEILGEPDVMDAQRFSCAARRAAAEPASDHGGRSEGA